MRQRASRLARPERSHLLPGAVGDELNGVVVVGLNDRRTRTEK
jgi:hypothetical protein